MYTDTLDTFPTMIQQTARYKRGLPAISRLFDRLTTVNRPYTQRHIQQLQQRLDTATGTTWQIISLKNWGMENMAALYTDYKHLRPAVIFSRTTNGLNFEKVTFWLVQSDFNATANQ